MKKSKSIALSLFALSMVCQQVYAASDDYNMRVFIGKVSKDLTGNSGSEIIDTGVGKDFSEVTDGPDTVYNLAGNTCPDGAYQITRSELDIKIANGDDVTGVCTTGITDMSSLFKNKDFNQKIGLWDTSNVTSFALMFYGSTFNSYIGDWDVRKVTIMNHIFYGTEYFNQPLTNWNTSSLENMSYSFFRAKAFNQPLNHFNVTKVKDMTAMFKETESFNQPLNEWVFTQNVGMAEVFYDSVFNQDITGWYVDLVKNYGKFRGGSSKLETKNLPKFKLEPA